MMSCLLHDLWIKHAKCGDGDFKDGDDDGEMWILFPSLGDVLSCDHIWEGVKPWVSHLLKTA